MKVKIRQLSRDVNDVVKFLLDISSNRLCAHKQQLSRRRNKEIKPYEIVKMKVEMIEAIN